MIPIEGYRISKVKGPVGYNYWIAKNGKTIGRAIRIKRNWYAADKKGHAGMWADKGVDITGSNLEQLLEAIVDAAHSIAAEAENRARQQARIKNGESAMTNQRETNMDNWKETFINTADSRNTDRRIMEAIAQHDDTLEDAVRTWTNGLVDYDETTLHSFVDAATGNRLYDAAQLEWGDTNLRSAVLDADPAFMFGTIHDKVEERLSDLGYDSSNYDVDAMASDIEGNNLDLDEATDFSEYFTRTIVENSIINGQHKQAIEQADQFGLNYGLIKYQMGEGKSV